MPMLIISDSQLERELNPSKNIGSVVDIKRGRGNIHAVPDSLRQVIAETAIEGSSNKDVAEAFGISKSSVSAYKNDATSTKSYNEPDESLAKANDEVRDRITGLARTKLMTALDAITEENIANAKVRDIAGIAKDMSAIVKNLEPAGPTIQQNNQVIVYRPKQKDEDEFDVITVNE